METNSQEEESMSQDELLKAAQLIAGLRAENSAVCGNFEELQDLYTKLQKSVQETSKKLADEKQKYGGLFQKYIQEKQSLQEQLTNREREVLRIRSEGLQKSDFQKLQLRIREELEAPYIENIKALKATTEESRQERERMAREHLNEKAKADALTSALQEEIAMLKEQNFANAYSLEADLKVLRTDKDRLVQENETLHNKVAHSDALILANKQLSNEIEGLRKDLEIAQMAAQDAGLLSDKKIARIKAEHAAESHEFDTLQRRIKFLQSELRTANEANGVSQKSLAIAESRISTLELKMGESSRNIQTIQSKELERRAQAESAWNEERQTFLKELEVRDKILSSTSSRYRQEVESAAIESSKRIRDLESVHSETVHELEERCAELKAKISSIEHSSSEAYKEFMTQLNDAHNAANLAKSNASRAEIECDRLRKDVLRLAEGQSTAEGQVAVVRAEARAALDTLHKEQGSRADERVRSEHTIGKLNAEIAREREMRNLANKDLDTCREELRNEKALRVRDRKEYKDSLLKQRQQRRQLKRTTKVALNQLISAVDSHQYSLAEERKREKLFSEIEIMRKRQSNYLPS